MLKLVNGKRIDYHSALIMGATKNDRAFFSGSAKAYTVKEKLTWSGDFLFKHRDNLATNPHTAYLSFFSDHDITVDEYGSIEGLHSAYPFFTTYEHSPLSPYSQELSDNQYAKLGQKSVECELVSLVNTSVRNGNVEEPPIYYHCPDTYPSGSVLAHRYRHQHHSAYASVNRVHGYAYPCFPSTPEDSTSFMWIKANDSSMGAPIWWNSESKNRLVISSDLFYVDFLNDKQDISTNDLFMLSELSTHNLRVFNFFVNDNKKRRYFDKSNKWNIYLRNSSSFIASRYLNDVGVIELYDQYGVTIKPLTAPTFYPDITVDGVYEAAKCLIDWGAQIAWRPNDEYLRLEEGSAFINFGVCNEHESDDQSRLLFQTCKHMFMTDTILGTAYELQMIVGSSTINGIDLETERQRRNSAVVTTQPYHIVQPIGNSELVDYMFVDKDNNPVTPGFSKPDIFLRIKSSAALVKTLDDTLKLEEYNTDIINVFELEDPEAAADLAVDANAYFDFKNNFFSRQDNCLDDYIEILTLLNHPRFFIDPIGSKAAQYSTKMLVNGLGFTSIPNFDSSGNYDGTVRRVLRMYCSNFEYTDGTIISKEFLSTSMTSTVEYGHERFHPIVKLPGINGYVKIIERARQFEPSRSTDGKYVTTYVVEFPYCPGSYSERFAMNFDNAGEDVYRKAFIQYKNGYLFAGSHAIDSNGKYDANNERAAFAFVEMQCPMSAYVNSFVDPITHTEEHGGDKVGHVGDHATVERRKRTIRYPANLVFNWFDPELFVYTIRSPIDEPVQRLRIIHSYYPVGRDVDMKFILLPSSKMWKYDQNQYSSYINHENPSFVCEMDISSVFNDFTKYQKEFPILPDIKRWLYGYVKAMASSTLKSSGIELPYSDPSPGVLHTLDSNIVIEIWDAQSKIFGNTIATWRPISMSLFDDGKSPSSVIVDRLARFAGPSYHGDYVSYVFDMMDVPNGIFSFTDDGSGYTDVIPLTKLTNKVLYDKVNERSYYIVNTASEDGGSKLRIYCKHDPINDPALPEYLPVQDAVGQVGIYEPFKFISKSKENEFFTSESSKVDRSGIHKRMIDIRNTIPDVSGLTDLIRYIDDENKIRFRIRVLRSRQYPKTFYTKDTDKFQYTNLNAIIPTPSDINPWIGGASGWDWSRIGLTEDVLYLGMTYFQVLSK